MNAGNATEQMSDFNMRGGKLTFSRLILPDRTCSSWYARA
jgi:hypothetical protein